MLFGCEWRCFLLKLFEFVMYWGILLDFEVVFLMWEFDLYCGMFLGYRYYFDCYLIIDSNVVVVVLVVDVDKLEGFLIFKVS